MNFWAFNPDIFTPIESFFQQFLQEQGNELQSECYLPSAIDHFIQEKRLICHTLKTKASWLGVTYPKDKQKIQKALEEIQKREPYFK